MQAWASAAPLLVVRAMLGLDPDVPTGRVTLRPRLPPEIGSVALGGVPIGGRRVDIVARTDTAAVTGSNLQATVL